MEYFGIKTPVGEEKKSYISWITKDEHQSWALFFQYPEKYYRLPMFEAIKAYKAIGYQCVKLIVKET